MDRRRRPPRGPSPRRLARQPQGRRDPRTRAYTSLAELPGAPDLVVISLPAARSSRRSTTRSPSVRGRSSPSQRARGDRRGRKGTRGGRRRARPGGRGRHGRPELPRRLRRGRRARRGSNAFTPGSLGIISQSGNLALELSLLAAEYGIGGSRSRRSATRPTSRRRSSSSRTRPTSNPCDRCLCEDFRDGRAFARAGAAAVAAGNRSSCSRPGERMRGPELPHPIRVLSRARPRRRGRMRGREYPVCRHAEGARRPCGREPLPEPATRAARRNVGDGGGTGVVTADSSQSGPRAVRAVGWLA